MEVDLPNFFFMKKCYFPLKLISKLPFDAEVAKKFLNGIYWICTQAFLMNNLTFFNIFQQFIFRFRESMPCEQLVSSLCDLKQAYTQYGGKRPFGVSILYMGWDSHHGYQLYHSDPAGTYVLFCDLI